MIPMGSRVWFLQSNPKHYDIDAALKTLDRIWWRVPQYTNEIHAGDVAVLWRSGKEAGIVGIGRIVSEPQRHQPHATEEPFVLADEEGAGDATRALIRIQTVPFIAKEQLRAITEFEQHQIVIAPMGTVFPVSETEWTALSKFLPQPPEVIEEAGGALLTSLTVSGLGLGRLADLLVCALPGGILRTSRGF